MKPLLLTPLIALVIILLAVPTRAAWGTDSCQPVGLESGYKWVRSTPEEFALFQNGSQVGALRVKGRAYFSLLPDQSWQQEKCPCELPAGVCQCPDGCSCPPDDCHCGPKNADDLQGGDLLPVPPGGVDGEKVEADKYILNGRPCTKRDVRGALQKASLPVDRNKLRLTIIGQPDATANVLRDLAAIPEAGDYLTQAYQPDHWAVCEKLAAGQAFTIVVESPDGAVLHRQNDYVGGQKSLQAALISTKADYDAAHDPDRRRPQVLEGLLKHLESVPLEIWCLIGLGIALLIWKGK